VPEPGHGAAIRKNDEALERSEERMRAKPVQEVEHFGFHCWV